ncbi:hypothetical protein HYV31_02150 [candidate division WWE3 bacterium]|nr:hypothetical protein [candidate division WWE3 bacterium]
MMLYIAYKYTHIADKLALKDELIIFAKLLEKSGHSTFMLGRDVQKWDNTNHSLPHKTMIITKNIKKSDAIVAFVTSDVFSKGLIFEFVFARLIGKRVFLVTKREYLTSFLKMFSTKVILYKEPDELEAALKCIIN